MKVIKSFITSVALFAVSGFALAADVAPVFIENSCTKEYPVVARANEEVGVAKVSYLVDASGKILESKLVGSSGYDMLDKEAARTFSFCKFHPGTKDGIPTTARVTVAFKWEKQ